MLSYVHIFMQDYNTLVLHYTCAWTVQKIKYMSSKFSVNKIQSFQPEMYSFHSWYKISHIRIFGTVDKYGTLHYIHISVIHAQCHCKYRKHVDVSEMCPASKSCCGLETHSIFGVRLPQLPLATLFRTTPKYIGKKNCLCTLDHNYTKP